jgi:hypothetical protein
MFPIFFKNTPFKVPRGENKNETAKTLVEPAFQMIEIFSFVKGIYL